MNKIEPVIKIPETKKNMSKIRRKIATTRSLMRPADCSKLHNRTPQTRPRQPASSRSPAPHATHTQCPAVVPRCATPTQGSGRWRRCPRNLEKKMLQKLAKNQNFRILLVFYNGSWEFRKLQINASEICKKNLLKGIEHPLCLLSDNDKQDYNIILIHQVTWL